MRSRWRRMRAARRSRRRASSRASVPQATAWSGSMHSTALGHRSRTTVPIQADPLRPQLVEERRHGLRVAALPRPDDSPGPVVDHDPATAVFDICLAHQPTTSSKVRVKVQAGRMTSLTRNARVRARPSRTWPAARVVLRSSPPRPPTNVREEPARPSQEPVGEQRPHGPRRPLWIVGPRIREQGSAQNDAWSSASFVGRPTPPEWRHVAEPWGVATCETGSRMAGVGLSTTGASVVASS